MRSRNPGIALLREKLPPPGNISTATEDEQYLWKIGDKAPSTKFDTSSTWTHPFANPPDVDWHRAVWFAGSIPKRSFLTWLITLNRLPTRDRLRG